MHVYRTDRILLTLFLVGGIATFPGCSDAPPTGLDGRAGIEESAAQDTAPPSEQVTVSWNQESLTFWPYTGVGLEGIPSDPINLVFTGEADPIQIRAALLSLNGDRSSLGLPPVPPFDALWGDAIGDVHTTYATDGGWTGSVIQLALGEYAPLRVHLRLFSTEKSGGGTWTLGAAHFEALIPGTADHEVLSWEFAQAVVVGDLLRTGLVPLDGVVATGLINAAPTFRAIRAPIYNELPPELVLLLGGPAQPVSADVPLPSDGQGALIHLAASVPVMAGEFPAELTFTYGQLAPRPLCNQGTLDYVYVQGPVSFHKLVAVGSDGSYSYTSEYSGRLTVIPMDVTVDPPVPSGPEFLATVGGNQGGSILGEEFSLIAHDRRIAPQSGGAGMLTTRLRVGSSGNNAYEVRMRCLEP